MSSEQTPSPPEWLTRCAPGHHVWGDVEGFETWTGAENPVLRFAMQTCRLCRSRTVWSPDESANREQLTEFLMMQGRVTNPEDLWLVDP